MDDATPREAAIMQFILSHDFTTPADVKKEFGYLYRTTVRNVLRKMASKGLITRNPLTVIAEQPQSSFPVVHEEQLSVAEFSRKWRKKHGFPPSISDVAFGLDMTYYKASTLVRSMKENGWIEGSDYSELRTVPSELSKIRDFLACNFSDLSYNGKRGRWRFGGKRGDVEIEVSASTIPKFSCDYKIILIGFPRNKVVSSGSISKTCASSVETLQSKIIPLLPAADDSRSHAVSLSRDGFVVSAENGVYSVEIKGLSRSAVEKILSIVEEKDNVGS